MSPRSRDLPRRSCHAVPGSSPRFIAKAPDLAADMVFLDLEDAVAPAEKEAARATVSEAVATGENGGEWLGRKVRVELCASKVTNPTARTGSRPRFSVSEADTGSFANGGAGHEVEPALE